MVATSSVNYEYTYNYPDVYITNTEIIPVIFHFTINEQYMEQINIKGQPTGNKYFRR